MHLSSYPVVLLPGRLHTV